MTGHVIIPLPGIGTLELSHEAYQAALRPIDAPPRTVQAAPTEVLVTARMLSASLNLPVSCIYEYAKSGRIPAVRAGKHVRFNTSQVLEALRVGHTQLPRPPL
jgi:excisionase family DNA binding protein